MHLPRCLTLPMPLLLAPSPPLQQPPDVCLASHSSSSAPAAPSPPLPCFGAISAAAPLCPLAKASQHGRQLHLCDCREPKGVLDAVTIEYSHCLMPSP